MKYYDVPVEVFPVRVTRTLRVKAESPEDAVEKAKPKLQEILDKYPTENSFGWWVDEDRGAAGWSQDEDYIPQVGDGAATVPPNVVEESYNQEDSCPE